MSERRKYYTQDNSIIEAKQSKMHKDILACLRCGFSMKQITKTLVTTINDYSIIIKDELKQS